jgi:hypothetical protein
MFFVIFLYFFNVLSIGALNKKLTEEQYHEYLFSST